MSPPAGRRRLAALRTLTAAVVPLVVLTASSGPTTLPDVVPVPRPSPLTLTTTPLPAPAAADEPSSHGRKSPTSYRRALTKALDRRLGAMPGRLSVSVRDLSTGRSFTYNRALRTATASIVKANLVMALLLKAQRRHRGLLAWERRAAARAIKVSDNAAASALWTAIGGGAGLAAADRRLGLRETRPGPGGAWGSTTTSAADQVRLLAALTSSLSPLSAANRRYLLGLMRHVTPEQAWGVSASGGHGTALKNGWLPRERDGGRWTVNSIGRVRHRGHTYLIAVLSDRHTSLRAGVQAVEDVTRLVTRSLR
ncbi:serine hydrolase [Actinomadura sp. ATCC 31491]|uniref:Serine hydrolase n=1 Tax=Actinomadura luzonensis TaxID=2805427 RepID=A0ABT0FZ06_9ACTN|nr:serine hydrolase [Actinomadura luzonensis]MCK2217584.1 serine hydrolase [Actinomadura luzonensis]